MLPRLPLAIGRLAHCPESADIASIHQHERIDMPGKPHIQDLPADEIATLLANDGNNVSPQQAAALREFIEDIGGLENARAAVEMLSQLRDAA
jgi:hypothetical protein